jgi:hypothetical protein
MLTKIKILPTAQRLLDELLKSTETSINLVPGAPDPTAGASRNDPSSWCLDEHVLTENVHKSLLRFIIPPNTPHVVSDIDSLDASSTGGGGGSGSGSSGGSSSAATTAAEYTSLLRPLRGNREPEAMWNLMGIVREMYKRRDKNAVPLLRTLTRECTAHEPLLQLWFLVKASPFYYDKPLFNTISTSSSSHHNHHHHHHHHGGGNNRNSNSNSGSSNLTASIHQACANLMDELVGLWRLGCLDPLVHDFAERQLYSEQLHAWQLTVYEKIKKFYTNVLNMSSNLPLNNIGQGNNNNNNNWGGGGGGNSAANSANNNNFERMLKRLDMDLFGGFLAAIHASRLAWTEFEMDNLGVFRQHCRSLLITTAAIEVTPTSINEVKTNLFYSILIHNF